MRSTAVKLVDVSASAESVGKKTLLHLITCGSVDDGKSTLLGRLLQETDSLPQDELERLTDDSRKFGTQGNATDFALLSDGLSAERQQGITIDVAYRFFSTTTRKFVVADTPGHEQYTRNMVSGAASADAALLLVDARNGLSKQSLRHSYLVGLLGVRHLVLAVNKMDLVSYSETVFNQIVETFQQYAKNAGIDVITAVPVSALHGDNITERSANMPWYHGSTILSCLETLPVEPEAARELPFRMAVQWVNRPNMDFRGYAGTVSSGEVRSGDTVRIQPSGKPATVDKIVTADGDLELAVAGQSITLTMTEEIDVSRGDVISTTDEPASTADQFECSIIWMDESAMLAGRPYVMKIGTQQTGATITDIKHEINVTTLEQTAAKQLEQNAIGICNLSTDRQIAFDAFKDNRDTGGFILIDKLTNQTVGIGMLNFALRRSDNIHMQAVDVDKGARSELKSQKACILWFTGLSGAGKSTIANIVERKLAKQGRHTYLLDGDNVRHGLNKDLGFTDADRVENIRRIGEVAGLMVDSGLIVLSAFISPFRSERQMARNLVDDDEFLEVYVETPLSIAEERDPKGLYKKARRGELKNFTGIDSPYEPPETPEILVNTASHTAEQAAERVILELRKKGIIGESD